MLFSKIKILVSYCLVVFAGLLVGYSAMNLPKWLKAPYEVGNYARYFPDKNIKVIVYGTQTCPFCIKTREFLSAQKVQFSDLDIEKFEKAKQDFLSLGGESVPLIIIGDRRIEGFNAQQIDTALAALALSVSKK